jgi:hypothetical protein
MTTPPHIAFDPFECFRESWRALFQTATLPLVMGGLFAACTKPKFNVETDNSFEFDLSEGFDLRGFSSDPLEAIRPYDPRNGFLQDYVSELTPYLVVTALVASAMMLLVHSWVQGGYLRLQAQSLRDHRGGFGTLFSGADCFVAMLLWNLLRYTIIAGVAAACFAPFALIVGGRWWVEGSTNGSAFWLGIGALITVAGTAYTVLGLVLGDRFVAIDGCTPLVALERSWQAASGQRLTLILFFLIAGAAYTAGFLTCCVGLIFAIPLVDGALTQGYLRLRPPGG